MYQAPLRRWLPLFLYTKISWHDSTRLLGHELDSDMQECGGVRFGVVHDLPPNLRSCPDLEFGGAQSGGFFSV